MSYFLFVIYFGLFCWLLYKSGLLLQSGLRIPYWILFFCIKTAASCYYGYFFSTQKGLVHADTWRLHQEALQEYPLIFKDPIRFFTDLFGNNYQHWSGLFEQQGYFNDFKDNLMLLVISIMDIFSGGNYYVNALLFSFISFWGFVFIYISCVALFKKQPSWLSTCILLLSPSCLFWTAGIHRDGLVLLFFGLSIYWASKIMGGLINKRAIICFILSVFCLGAFRNYVAILFILSFMPWIIVKQFEYKPKNVFSVYTVLCIAMFFLSGTILSSAGLPQKIIDRKKSFEMLQANSRMDSINLQPNFASYVQAFPMAMEHVTLDPLPWKAHTKMEWLAALEMFFSIALLLFCWVKSKGGSSIEVQSLSWLLVLFCVSNLILTGYVVPFSGAIVRYRSMFVMLLLLVSSMHIKIPKQQIRATL